MTDLIIHERESGGHYEVWAIKNGVLFHKDVYRDPIGGWPFDYKQKAHDEIKSRVTGAPHD